MKIKATTILAGTACTAIAVTCFFLLPFSKAVTHPNLIGGMSEDDAQGRMKWEISRLADESGHIPENIRAKELAFAATLPNDAGRSQLKSFGGWNNRGPYNVGGTTHAFGIDKLNENNLLAATVSGGMWRSADAGASWGEVTPALSYHGFTCLSQDQRPGHESTWYAGTGNPWASASGGAAFYTGDGLIKSTDNGVTWATVPTTSTGYQANLFTSNWQIVYNIALDKHNTAQDVAYAACYGAIYKTTNAWTTITAPLGGGSYFTDVAVNDSGVVYATLDTTGTSAGIWRSPDGITFTNIIPAGFPTGYNRIVMCFNPLNQKEVYFLANTPHYGHKTVDFRGNAEWNSLWKYTYVSGTGNGAGGVWQDLTANLPGTGGKFDKWYVQGSYDMIIRVKPDDSSTVFIGGTDLYRSSTAFTDSTHTTYIGGYQHGGTLPVLLSYANHHPDQHNVTFLPSNPQVMFSCNDGGIFKTTNDTANTLVWTPLNNGYVTSMFYTIALDHGTPGNNIIIGGMQDNGSWYTNSANPLTPWVHPAGGDGAYCAIADGQSAYYFSIENGWWIMRALLDGSGNITSFRRIDPIGGKKYQWINPFVLDPNNNNIMYLAGGKNIWRNDNLSAIPMSNQWDSITTNWVKFPDSVATTNSTITAVSISKTPANRLYYGTDQKRVYRLNNANVGLPSQPTDITSPLFPNAYVSSIAVDPNNADHLMVIYSNYNVYSIFSSLDGGTTWAKAAGNLEANSNGSGNGPSIRWGSIMHVGNGTVYLVGTSIGLFATDTLKGLNTVWVQQGTTTIGNQVCDMIDCRPSDGTVIVGTHSGGAYSAVITSVSDIAGVQNQVARNFGLTNYPNPFGDQSTVEFDLKTGSKVHLSVLDEVGREVMVLKDGFVPDGKHTLTLQRNGLPPGMYYLSLRVGEAVETRKLLLVN